jgi:hypothetical protein
MSGRLAFRSKGLKEWVISSWRHKGVPIPVVNTSPLSRHSPASFAFSSSWVLQCPLKAPFAISGSFIDRLTLAVFGGLMENPLPVRVDSVG